MNKSTLVGIGVGAAAVAAVGAFATTRLDNGSPFQSYATVVSVEPAFVTAQVPREVCRDETVTRQKPVKDEKRIAGTAIGAVVGGLVVGLTAELSAAYIDWIGQDLRMLPAFLLILVVLLVRPQGLFGKAEVTRV